VGQGDQERQSKAGVVAACVAAEMTLPHEARRRSPCSQEIAMMIACDRRAAAPFDGQAQ
jgi:hypothetical protein